MYCFLNCYLDIFLSRINIHAWLCIASVFQIYRIGSFLHSHVFLCKTPNWFGPIILVAWIDQFIYTHPFYHLQFSDSFLSETVWLPFGLLWLKVVTAVIVTISSSIEVASPWSVEWVVHPGKSSVVEWIVIIAIGVPIEAVSAIRPSSAVHAIATITKSSSRKHPHEPNGPEGDKDKLEINNSKQFIY